MLGKITALSTDGSLRYKCRMLLLFVRIVQD